ncbi:MAG: hypothetical protein M1840_002420 [Geoglossum simile]|nr:MAG: hypothetical protein M1840_002420 [Geoglossum simile]
MAKAEEAHAGMGEVIDALAVADTIREGATIEGVTMVGAVVENDRIFVVASSQLCDRLRPAPKDIRLPGTPGLHNRGSLTVIVVVAQIELDSQALALEVLEEIAGGATDQGIWRTTVIRRRTMKKKRPDKDLEGIGKMLRLDLQELRASRPLWSP